MQFRKAVRGYDTSEVDLFVRDSGRQIAEAENSKSRLEQENAKLRNILADRDRQITELNNRAESLVLKENPDDFDLMNHQRAIMAETHRIGQSYLDRGKDEADAILAKVNKERTTVQAQLAADRDRSEEYRRAQERKGDEALAAAKDEAAQIRRDEKARQRQDEEDFNTNLNHRRTLAHNEIDELIARTNRECADRVARGDKYVAEADQYKADMIVSADEYVASAVSRVNVLQSDLDQFAEQIVGLASGMNAVSGELTLALPKKGDYNITGEEGGIDVPVADDGGVDGQPVDGDEGQDGPRDAWCREDDDKASSGDSGAVDTKEN